MGRKVEMYVVCRPTVWHSAAASAPGKPSKSQRSRARSGLLQCRVGRNGSLGTYKTLDRDDVLIVTKEFHIMSFQCNHAYCRALDTLCIDVSRRPTPNILKPLNRTCIQELLT